MIKHTGKVASTGRRVVVVFPSIPEDQDNCLVVDVDALDEKYHDGLMQAVESPEGQASNKLYEVLGRKLFWDGRNILTTLHEKGFLRRVPVDTVTLIPSPTETLPLKEFNAYQQMITETKQAKATRVGIAVVIPLKRLVVLSAPIMGQFQQCALPKRKSGPLGRFAGCASMWVPLWVDRVMVSTAQPSPSGKSEGCKPGKKCARPLAVSAWLR